MASPVIHGVKRKRTAGDRYRCEMTFASSKLDVDTLVSTKFPYA